MRFYIINYSSPVTLFHCLLKTSMVITFYSTCICVSEGMERRKSVRCAVIQAQRELKMKENEEAAKQVTSEEGLKPLSMRPSNQPRNTTSKSLHALPDEKRKSKVGPKSKEHLTSPAPQLSDYEKQIQKNIEERKKMFEMMVSSAKREFLQAVSLEASSTSKQLSVKRKRDSADE